MNDALAPKQCHIGKSPRSNVSATMPEPVTDGQLPEATPGVGKLIAPNEASYVPDEASVTYEIVLVATMTHDALPFHSIHFRDARVFWQLEPPKQSGMVHIGMMHEAARNAHHERQRRHRQACKFQWVGLSQTC